MTVDKSLRGFPVSRVNTLICPFTKKTFEKRINGHLFHQVPRPYHIASVFTKEGGSFLADAVAVIASGKTYEKINYFIIKDKRVGFNYVAGFKKGEITPLVRDSIIAFSNDKSSTVSDARKRLLENSTVSYADKLQICHFMLTDNVDDIFALVRAGNLLREQGYLEPSRTVLFRALRLHPTASFTWTSVASMYHAKGELAKAYASFSKALEFEPNNETIKSFFNDFVQHDQALVKLQACLGNCSKLFHINVQLGPICDQMNRNKDAVRYLEAAVEFAPQDGPLLALLANNLRKVMVSEGVNQAQCERAQMLFEAAIKQGYDNSFVRSRLADVYRMKNDSSQAYFQCMRALKHNPHDLFALIQFGTIATQIGDFDVAGECFRKCISLKPSWVVGYERLADLYSLENVRRDGAQSLYEKAFELDPNNKYAQRRLQEIIQQRKAEEATAQSFLA